jgi:hypothetical protein
MSENVFSIVDHRYRRGERGRCLVSKNGSVSPTLSLGDAERERERRRKSTHSASTVGSGLPIIDDIILIKFVSLGPWVSGNPRFLNWFNALHCDWRGTPKANKDS